MNMQGDIFILFLLVTGIVFVFIRAYFMHEIGWKYGSCRVCNDMKSRYCNKDDWTYYPLARKSYITGTIQVYLKDFEEWATVDIGYFDVEFNCI